MDFESIMPAVPLYNENRPYQQIPFQYSLHVVADERKNTNVHFEFLGVPPGDPRPCLIESLLGHLEDRGSIIVWNDVFERGRLSTQK